MAVPKRKKSKSRTRTRRTHQGLTAPNVIACPSCGEPMLPHQMCSHCGKYRGRVVKEVEEV
ncbi:MAG TPA: 50S ribosomal protein L32 [bacterium]|nr:50S ribosomal protein L32 [bacterium]